MLHHATHPCEIISHLHARLPQARSIVQRYVSGWLQLAANNSIQAQSPIGVHGTSIYTYHFGLMPCSSQPRCTLLQSHWPHALGALKAETTAACMASGGSKCSFLSFEGNDSKASVTTMAAIVSAALIFYQKNLPETCTLCPPNNTLACEVFVKIWNDRETSWFVFVTVPPVCYGSGIRHHMLLTDRSGLAQTWPNNK